MTVRRYRFPLLILLVGLLATLLAAWQFARGEQRRSEARFDGLVQSVLTDTRNQMELHLALLRGGAGLFNASEGVTAEEWRRYIGTIELTRNYPGILGIGFAEAGVVGRPVPGNPTSSGLVSSIRFLEPMNRRNQAAIGIDMLSEATRREAMMRAWTSGRPALSGMVRLVQEVDRNKQPGFLLYLPLREPDGVFRGWVYSPLRGYDLFGALFHRPEFRGLRIAVHDGRPRGRGNMLYASGPSASDPKHHRSVGLPVAGRDLVLDIGTNASFEAAAPLALAPIVIVLGSLATFLLAALAWQQQRNAERTREQVDLATAELRAANQRLREETKARSAAEVQLQQAQKMEAVGQLTGGIAHDFNNMLAVIIGSLDFARHTDDLPRLRRLIEQALKGATKAAELTQRLLAFSRRQTLVPSVVDANALVAEMSELLRRTLGGAITMETVLAGGLWRTFADPVQLESAMLNLAVNARDAMPDGGELTIETANCYLDEAYAKANPDVPVGAYVMIAVSDTGVGMTPEIQSRVLEPFFTTKEVGKGTGLGLPQVFGFVKQSGGHLKIYSEAGRGTTIRIYLPRHRGGELVGRTVVGLEEALPRGRPEELILAVEDEEDVRLMSVGALRDLGYTVIHAADGADALRRLESNPGVRLVFSDVVMPQMDGTELAARIREHHPEIRLLLTSGYARQAMDREKRLPEGVDLISKPFTITQLAQKVRHVLDAPLPRS